MKSVSTFTLTALAILIPVSTLAADWPNWSRDGSGNMVAPDARGIPVDFNPGREIGRSGKIDPKTTKHIKWIAKLGSQTYGNPVVSQGRVLVGTNNGSPRNDKFKGDRSPVYCFDEKTGKFLWEFNLPKLGAGKVSDWEYLGICSSPSVEGKYVYLITNLCEVVCIDLYGMADGNDGPFKDEATYFGGGTPIEIGPGDADVIWRYDLREELNVFPHNITSSSPLIVGDMVVVSTSNGVDWSHINIPNPRAPALIGLDKKTGKLVAEEGAGISLNLLHCNWSSPSFAVIAGKPTILFAAGDGFIYGFDPKPQKDADGFGIFPMRWKIDGNPPEYRVGPDGKPIKYATAPGPSEFIATPTHYKGHVYAAIGQDPEHGLGVGALSCVDPSTINSKKEPKLVWRDKTLDRNISTAACADGLCYVTDYKGVMRCYDAKNGKIYWEQNTLAHVWGSPLIADGKVFQGNEDGILTIMEHSKEKKLLAEVEFNSPIYTSPIWANGVLYVGTQSHLYAIQRDGPGAMVKR